MNDRPPSINEPGQENLDRNILRNEIHVFLSETGWGIFNRNSGEISSGIDTGGTTTGMLLCYIFLALQTQQRRAWLTMNRSTPLRAKKSTRRGPVTVMDCAQRGSVTI